MIYICIGDTKLVDPNQLSEGFTRYAESNLEHLVFEFLLNYVRRMKSDSDWKKLLKKNPEKPLLLFVTPSDIAYILALIKNGMGMWEQVRRLQENLTLGVKKALSLFTKGEGQKRESGKTVWNNEGLNFHYTAERNWKEVYNDKDKLLDLCNKWEQWEPEEKSRKNLILIRTYWKRNEEQKDDIVEEEPVEWLEEQNKGYTEETDEEPDFYWNEDLKNGTGGIDRNDKVNDEKEDHDKEA